MSDTPTPRDLSLRQYRVVITLQHRLDRPDAEWTKPVKVIGRAWAKDEMEAQAMVANRKVMDRIRITVQKSELI